MLKCGLNCHVNGGEILKYEGHIGSEWFFTNKIFLTKKIQQSNTWSPKRYTGCSWGFFFFFKQKDIHHLLLKPLLECQRKIKNSG